MDTKSKVWENALEGIELTATMEKTVRERYESISNYLISKDMKLNFLPIGSFYIGTAIKPYLKDKDSYYDLDILCLNEQESIFICDAEKYKKAFGDKLKENEIYKNKLEDEYDRCWTLRYAEKNDFRFKLDLIPGIANVSNYITQKENNKYNWEINRSIEHGDWFIKISNKILTFEDKEKGRKAFGEVYNKVEEIPNYYFQSNLQKAVKLLKRSRDIFYSEITNDLIQRPSSIIISTATAITVEKRNISDLEGILKETVLFIKAILKDEQPYLNNPVYPAENFLESYNSISINYFKRWIETFEKEFLTIAFGEQFKLNVKNFMNKKLFPEFDMDYTNVKETKPWKK